VKLAAVALFSAISAITACEKAADMPKLKDEANGLRDEDKPKVDDLDRRVTPLLEAGRKLPRQTPGLEAAGSLLGEARGAIDQMRATLASEPTDVDRAVDSGTVENLVAVVDRMRATFDRDEVVATADITSVESWMAQVVPGALPTVVTPPPAMPTP
jgi:hypothetical protein